MRRFLAVLALSMLFTVAWPEANDRLVSDRFWRAFAVAASEVEQYDDLQKMAAEADAVIIGRIETVVRGRVFGAPVEDYPFPEEGQVHYAQVTILVQDVLAGSLPPDHLRAVSLEVLIPNPPDPSKVSGSWPTEEAIFFLRNKGIEASRLGFDSQRVQAEDSFYRLVILEAYLRIFDGVIAPPPYATTPFILSLEGAQSDDVVDLIRSAAGDG